MRLVVFALPFFSETSSRMVEAIASIPDVALGVISGDPQERAGERTRAAIAAHYRVDDVLDPAQLVRAATNLRERLGIPIHRMFAAFEHLQVPIAEARAMLGVDGMRAEAAANFRDKARMKSMLRANGIPCARHALAESVDGAVRAAHDVVGYPLVAKPPAGAGAVATFRADDARMLREGLAAAPPKPGAPVLLEEFVRGTEHSLETISIDGRAVWHSLTHYYPTPLQVLQNPWIQWALVLPREVDDPRYDDIKQAARQALDVLGMRTGLSHMEWFRRDDGSLAISEVGARPPGAQITTLVSRANDIDFVRDWARVMVDERFDVPERKYAVGAAYLRGQGDGRVAAVHGLDEIGRALGTLICDVKLPTPGQTPTGSYEGEGYIILRHPSTDVVERAISMVISTVRVELA
jgi:biotin carboxylase